MTKICVKCGVTFNPPPSHVRNKKCNRCCVRDSPVLRKECAACGRVFCRNLADPSRSKCRVCRKARIPVQECNRAFTPPPSRRGGTKCASCRGNLVRRRVNYAIKSEAKSGSAVRDLGCSIDEFKAYIAAKFVDGMTWDNYGEWHLDHIRPLASFNLADRNQFLEACHFSNYQPLWAADNIAKGARIRWRSVILRPPISGVRSISCAPRTALRSIHASKTRGGG